MIGRLANHRSWLNSHIPAINHISQNNWIHLYITHCRCVAFWVFFSFSIRFCSISLLLRFHLTVFIWKWWMKLRIDRSRASTDSNLNKNVRSIEIQCNCIAMCTLIGIRNSFNSNQFTTVDGFISFFVNTRFPLSRSNTIYMFTVPTQTFQVDYFFKLTNIC